VSDLILTSHVPLNTEGMILVYKSRYIFMGRSARVRKDYIEKVKAAVQRQGFPRQRELALELGLSLATVEYQNQVADAIARGILQYLLQR
jgi:hypothetical protein